MSKDKYTGLSPIISLTSSMSGVIDFHQQSLAGTTRNPYGKEYV